ncbi:hypothetical protein EVA_13415 [gut metagenome]|uniref:Uncharacterized protein n=1 Tax=gut metagenome TaxID=749906 RepID=J9G9L8_9ZZZZ
MDTSPLCTLIIIILCWRWSIARQFSIFIVERSDHLSVVAQICQRSCTVSVLILAQIQPAIVVAEVQHLKRLRKSPRIKLIHTDEVLQISTLMIIKAKVNEFQFVTHTRSIDKADLIERRAHLIDIVEFTRIRLGADTTRQGNITFTIKSDGSRIARHGRDFCTECIHGPTHTNIASRTIQVSTCQGFQFIDILCIHRQSYQ